MGQTSEISRYLEDASGFQGKAEQVFLPETEDEVVRILADASTAGVPVTVAGAGTGVTGARVAQSGWVLSVERLRRLEIQNGSAICGPGVLLKELDQAARRTGQFYPPDPTEYSASVGGTIATNASGSRSFLYGSTRRWLRRIRVAQIDGSVHEYRRGDRIDFEAPEIPHSQATKHSAGYLLAPAMEWIDLFAGSEGTLGVVTEAELGLLPVPAALLSGVVFFPDGDKALEAVAGWRPIPRLRMLEFIDGPSLNMLRPRFPEVPAAAGAALLIEQEMASEDSPEIDEWLDRLIETGALEEDSWFGAEDRDRERFRRFRHALPEIVNDTVRKRGFQKIGSDYAVPFERNAAMFDFYRDRLEAEFPEQYVIFGHVGDAHLHVNILPSSPEEAERARNLMVEFAREAVRLGGTVSAEHGLGKRKAHLLEIQYTPDQLAAMRAVKQRLDPQWLLGRGTLFAPPEQ